MAQGLSQTQHNYNPLGENNENARNSENKSSTNFGQIKQTLQLEESPFYSVKHKIPKKARDLMYSNGGAYLSDSPHAKSKPKDFIPKKQPQLN